MASHLVYSRDLPSYVVGKTWYADFFGDARLLRLNPVKYVQTQRCNGDSEFHWFPLNPVDRRWLFLRSWTGCICRHCGLHFSSIYVPEGVAPPRNQTAPGLWEMFWTWLWRLT